jgi:molecular chaperone DnaK
MSYQVGVDVGGTFTTTAVVRDGRAEVVSVVPSELPGVPRGFLRRVGDNTPVLVGARPVPAETLVAQLVSQVVSKIGKPARLAVTHPVTWGPHRVAALRSALGEVTMLSTAAAVAYRSDYPTAVHDLGGSTFTSAVVRGFATVGQPVELDLGGVDLDELVFDHVREAVGDDLPTDAASLARLRQACTAAKEALSADTEVEIPVAGQGVRLTRAEFEAMARPLLDDTAAALRLTIEESGLTPATVLLAGGAAWLPLLTQVVSAELGRPVTATPRGAAAMGAALAAGDALGLPAAAAKSTFATPNAPQGTRATATPHAAGPGAAPPPQAATRLALSLEQEGEVRTSLVEPVRPPVPAAAAPGGTRSKRPRTVVAAAIAAFAVVGAAAAIALTSGQAPRGAGAEPMPTTTTTETTTPTTTTVAPPPQTKDRQTPPPQPGPTTTTRQKTTTTTTTTDTPKPPDTPRTTSSTPPSTTTTTQNEPNARVPETSEGGER